MFSGPVKFLFGCSLLFPVLLSTSCGGGNMNVSTANSTDLTGNWQIQLSYAESADIGGSAPDGNTIIKVPLAQVTKGSSVLNGAGQGYADDVGCNGGAQAGNFWYFQGGFNPVVFFQSGQVQNSSLSLVLQISHQQIPASNDPHGQLNFIGILNADGTLSGTVTDECDTTNSQPKQGTWTAHRITTIP